MEVPKNGAKLKKNKKDRSRPQHEPQLVSKTGHVSDRLKLACPKQPNKAHETQLWTVHSSERYETIQYDMSIWKAISQACFCHMTFRNFGSGVSTQNGCSFPQSLRNNSCFGGLIGCLNLLNKPPATFKVSSRQARPHDSEWKRPIKRVWKLKYGWLRYAKFEIVWMNCSKLKAHSVNVRNCFPRLKSHLHLTEGVSWL